MHESTECSAAPFVAPTCSQLVHCKECALSRRAADSDAARVRLRASRSARTSDTALKAQVLAIFGAETRSVRMAFAVCCVELERASELVCALSFNRRALFERAVLVQQPSGVQTLAPLAARAASLAVLTAPYRSLEAGAASIALGTLYCI